MKSFRLFFAMAFLALACQVQDDPAVLSDKASSGPGTPGAYVISSVVSTNGKVITITVDQSAAKAASNMLFKLLACNGSSLQVSNVSGFTINGINKMDKLNSSVGQGTACSTVYADPYIHLQQTVNADVMVIEITVDTEISAGSFVIKSTDDCFGTGDPAYAFTHSCLPPPTCFEEESAWATGLRYVSRGNWATYTPYKAGTVNVYAGKNKFAGTATFSAESGGNVTITIALNSGWSLQEVSNPVKINGYIGAVPVGNPSPGRFASKGSSLTVTLPVADAYGIHLDVREAVTCPE